MYGPKAAFSSKENNQTPINNEGVCHGIRSTPGSLEHRQTGWPEAASEAEGHQGAFADAWPVIEGWLIAEPHVTGQIVMDRLAAMIPQEYARKAQLRTLQRRIKAWRAERVKTLILGALHQPVPIPVEA